MEVVGRCPGDKRKRSDVRAAEIHSLGTPMPSDSGDKEALKESANDEKKKKQEHQHQHTEARFGECLAQEAGRSSSARSAP